MFKGSIVALITPMTADGRIETSSLRKLIDWHIESGTNAIVIAGTTGESVKVPLANQLISPSLNTSY